MPGVPWARFDTDSIIHMSRVIISVVVLFSLFPTWCCLASLSKQIGHLFAMILFSDLVEQA